MKKLLITTDSFLPRWDGIARFLTELIPDLKEDFEITVLCPAFEGKVPHIPGVKIIRLPLLRIRFGDIYFSSFNRKRVRSIVAQNDLVFNQSLGPIGMSAIIAGKKLKKPVISYVHSLEWELVSKSIRYFRRPAWWLVKKLARHFYNNCSLLLVPSKEIRDLFTLEGINTEKQVVKLGIDTQKFVPPVNREEAKKAIGISPNHTVISYVGRLGREKKLITLYKAFERVRQETKNVILLIVGEGIIDDIKANSHVLHVGSQDNVVPYYQASDIYVLPSLTETTSLTTLEAMGCGCTVVATPVGSIREYIEDGENGIIFPRRDVATLTELLQFLVQRPESRKILAAAARKTVEEERNWEDTLINIRNALKNY